VLFASQGKGSNAMEANCLKWLKQFNALNVVQNAFTRMVWAIGLTALLFNVTYAVIAVYAFG